MCEDRPEEEDYADMPRLIPIDQEDDFCLPGPRFVYKYQIPFPAEINGSNLN